MGAESVTRWYGVCDECGEQDDDSRLTEEEARARMWSYQGRDLCWDCFEKADVPEGNRRDNES